MLALTPSLANLATVLRHREMWPEGFWWDYRNCSACGVGLAFRLGMISYTGYNIVAEAFDIPIAVADKIFFRLGRDLGLAMAAVTPEHVADAIDEYLAEQRPPESTP